MKKSVNKNKFTTIALIVMLTMSSLILSLSLVYAQEPDYREKQTYGVLVITPNPVGVNQEVLVSLGITDYLNSVGDGWEGLMLTVTDPAGDVTEMGPYRTDSTGLTGTLFIPDMVGEYTFQVHFPTQWYNWTSPPMFDPEIYGNILYLESDSDVITLDVQEDPIPVYPGFSLPTEYWTRPINAQIREWWSISGSWFTNPPNMFAQYNEFAPEAPHILWSKPLTYGGLAGGNLGGHAFSCGDAYQGKWQNPVILAGVVYYNTYPGSVYGGVDPNNEIVAVDLHTGEELWRREGATVSFGQTFYWSGQNAHHVFAYIWEEASEFDMTTFTFSTTWNAYNAFDGKYVYTITNPPSRGAMFGASNTVIGPNGEILVYTVNMANSSVSLWDSSKIGVGFEDGSWEASGTYNGSLGYVWEKPIPEGLAGSVVAVLEDRIIGSSAGGLTSMDDAPIDFWAVSLEEGKEGTLLWQSTWNPPTGQLGISFQAASVEDGVFVVKASETRQYYGFSIDTGNNIWGPTESQGLQDIYAMESNIAYGKLFSTGYAGIVYCYDVKTGNLDWSYEARDPYTEILWGNNWPLHQVFIADNKIYVSHSEHSPIDPKPRGAPLICIDIESGEALWEISLRGTDWGGKPIIGDSIIAMYNTYDQQVYAVGKGPSCTTVSIQDDVVSLGNSVMIKGTVTDVSPGVSSYAIEARFPNGVPAISDDNMSEWMEYVYMQFPRPDATGVPVRLTAIGASGDEIDVGWATSNDNGMFMKMWQPPAEGEYTIVATFGGTESYYGSTAETALGVTPAVTVSTPIEPEPTPEELTPEEPTTPEPTPEEPTTPEQPTPEEPEPTVPEHPLISAELAIVIAILAACIIGAVAYIALRRRK